MIAAFRPAYVFLVVAALAVGGCKRDSAARPSSSNQATAAAVPFDHRFTVDVGGQPVRMRMAVSSFEQERGLMNVSAMPEDEGMIFVYDHTLQMSFWMRNTIIPLDIGFFDAGGVLRDIHPMYPHVENPVKSSSDKMQLALEMNQGWFARHGVKPGAAIDLAALRAALRDRGFDPDRIIAGR